MMQPVMSARAKTYLWIRSAACALLGALTVFLPAAFSSDIYPTFLLLIPSTLAPPLILWGVGFVLVSLLLGVGAVRGKEGLARTALLSSAVITAAWMASYIAAGLVVGLWAPASIIAWLSLVAIDLVMLRRPLTIPFEDLLLSEQDIKPNS